jgi:hypothetical protein
LDAVLFNFSHLDCGDTRDRIYGLLGIVQEQDRVTVDYSKTARFLFKNVMCALRERVDSYPNLQMFRMLGIRMGATVQELRSCEFFSGKELLFTGMKQPKFIDPIILLRMAAADGGHPNSLVL